MEEPVEIALRAVVHDHSLRDVEAVGGEKMFGLLWDSRSQAANENQPPRGLFTRFYVKFVGQRPCKNTKRNPRLGNNLENPDLGIVENPQQIMRKVRIFVLMG